jgi:hypothetical protein
MFYRRLISCMLVLALAITFNQPCLGQDTVFPQRCSNDSHRDQYSDVRADAFDKGKNVGRNTRLTAPRQSGKAGILAALATALAMALIIFAEHNQMVVGGAAVIVVLFILGFICSNLEDDADETSAGD